jgi:hypothetical protein
MGPRTDLDDVLLMPGLGLGPPGRPARNQSYQLRSGSSMFLPDLVNFVPSVQRFKQDTDRGEVLMC